MPQLAQAKSNNYKETHIKQLHRTNPNAHHEACPPNDFTGSLIRMLRRVVHHKLNRLFNVPAKSMKT
jgi:hypothetical protein